MQTTDVQLESRLFAGISLLEKHEIVHRDINPDNMLLTRKATPGFEAFITDFKFAKLPPSAGQRVKSGGVDASDSEPVPEMTVSSVPA